MESSKIKHLALKLDPASFLPEATAPATRLHHKKYSASLNYKDRYQKSSQCKQLHRLHRRNIQWRVEKKKKETSLTDKHPFGTRLRLPDRVLGRTDFKAHITVPVPQELEN